MGLKNAFTNPNENPSRDGCKLEVFDRYYSHMAVSAKLEAAPFCRCPYDKSRAIWGFH